MIKQANTHDLERLAVLGKEFFSEAGLPGVFNPEFWATVWTQLMIQDAAEVWYDEENIINGAIGVIYAPDFLTGDLVATESFWFVTKEARSVIGIRLFHWIVDRSQVRGAKRLIMSGVISSPAFPGVSKFYRNVLEMKPLEMSYILTLE